jgi:hypothetical protein
MFLSITNFTLLYLKYVDGCLLSGLVKNRTHVLVYNQLYITVFKICGWLPVVGAGEESNPSVPGHVRLTLNMYIVQMWKRRYF